MGRRVDPMPSKFKATAVLAIALSATTMVAACSTPQAGTQTVKALWYGEQSDGSIAQGITPVTVSTDRLGTESSVSIDLSGMTDENTGAYWNATAYSAAAVATIGSAVDPRQVQIAFDVNEEIDGPSAGGLLTVGVSSDFVDEKVADDRSMTGTILPDGSLGPVGGIPAKIRAAAEAGIKTVVIPAGQRKSKDPESNKTVDVVDQGKELGVDVIEAASVTEAYQTIVGDSQPVPTADPGALDPDLAALLTSRAQATLKTLGKTTVARGSSPNAYDRLTQSVSTATTAANDALAKGDPVLAYAAASESLQVVIGWNASVGAKAQADKNLTATAAAVRADAEAVAAKAQDQLVATAATPVQFVEQVPALVDAMSWAVDAILESTRAAQTTQQASSSGQVAAAASAVARARYDVDEHLAAAVDGVKATGRTALSDAAAAWSFVGGYAALLGEAAQANHAYAKESSKTKQGPDSDLELSEVALAQWDKVQANQSSAADQAIRTATALSAFIATAQEVTGLGAVAALDAPDASTSAIAITTKETFERQVGVATAMGAEQARVLAGASLDPSYSMWGNAWGAVMAAPPTGALVADEVRREGLAYQWYSNVQAKMLTALARSN